jgi:hypothetical protein
VWLWAGATGPDGRAVFRELEPLPVSKIDDAPIPSMEVLHDFLEAPMIGVVMDEAEGLYRLGFDGVVTTESGATGQMVAETFFIDPDDYTKSSADVDPVLAMVWQARPDLRPVMAARYGMTEKAVEQIIMAPYFLGGYAFAYEDSGYFGYGDLDQNHSWVYLEGDLSVGSEFSLQLVPGLADDIWLYGRIWGVGDLTVNGIAYENVLECMYVVDMGIQTATDESGEVIGTSHNYMYGNSFFETELGPVAGTERRVLGPDPILQEGGPTLFEYVLDLVGVTYGE